MKLLLSSILVLTVMAVVIPSAFAQEDYMTLDRQNYSDGDTVKMSGFIEGKGGHILTIIIMHPSGKVMSSSHGYGPYDSFGMETRIIPTSWEDGIYTIVASSVGKEFVEVFGVNYILTEDDMAKYQQEQERKEKIKQVKNLLGNHVGVHADMANYVQGGMLKIYGYGHSVNDDGKTSPDESIPLKIYVKNSQTQIHEAEVGLDENGEFVYYLDTSDDTKWDYTTRTELPFGTPRGFYNVVAEFAETENEREFYLKATTEQKTNARTEQAKTSQQDAVHKITEEPRLATSNNEHTDAYLEWLEDSYLSTGTGVVRVTDPEMNLDPKAIDNFDVEVWSSSNPKNAISLTMTETDASTGIFQGTVTFALYDESSGHRLRVSNVDTIGAKHNDLISYSKISELASPLKQQKSGILAEDVTCKEGFEKIFRSYEGAAVCAKPLSAEKLVQRGWFR